MKTPALPLISIEAPLHSELIASHRVGETLLGFDVVAIRDVANDGAPKCKPLAPERSANP